MDIENNVQAGASEERTEELADKLEDAMEKAGGRKKLVERFGDVTVKLSKPMEWKGAKIEEIHLNFLGLTGLDMELIDDEIGAMGLRGLMPAYSRKYQRLLAARAADMQEEFFLKLPLADYSAVVGAASNFLLVTG